MGGHLLAFNPLDPSGPVRVEDGTSFLSTGNNHCHMRSAYHKPFLFLKIFWPPRQIDMIWLSKI